MTTLKSAFSFHGLAAWGRIRTRSHASLRELMCEAFHAGWMYPGQKERECKTCQRRYPVVILSAQKPLKTAIRPTEGRGSLKVTA